MQEKSIVELRRAFELHNQVLGNILRMLMNREAAERYKRDGAGNPSSYPSGEETQLRHHMDMLADAQKACRADIARAMAEIGR